MFLPKDYKNVPKAGGNYFKLEEGENKFRVLSSAIVGWEYWTPENKPKRLREFPTELPADIREDSVPKHFWAFVIFDYKDSKVKVAEITQVTIMDAMKSLIEDEDWGAPQEYDIVIKRSGEGLETKYTVSPKPKSELDLEEKDAAQAATISLEKLYDGGDPFSE